MNKDGACPLCEIPVTRIGAFCESNGIEQIDFLKLDVEGHELKILIGASNMLRSGRVKFIQFEFGSCNIDSRTYLRDFFELLGHEYRIYRILNRGLCPMNEYNDSYEIFKLTNCLAGHTSLLANQTMK